MRSGTDLEKLRRGACLCGAVRFTTRGPLRGVVFCHCSQCRRQSGHYYAATKVADDRLAIVGGEHLRWYRSSEAARRGFCSICGSNLFWKLDGADATSIAAGAFELPTELKGESHIFVADKGDYYEIADGLPQFARSTLKVPVAGD
jgi:hypothetical protein